MSGMTKKSHGLFLLLRCVRFKIFGKKKLYKAFSTIGNYLKSGYTRKQLAQYMHDHITGLSNKAESIRRNI